jgi:hypothetical protein
MATTGVAAEASSQSRRLPLDTIPGRCNGGLSFDSRIGKDGAAGIDAPGGTETVDWLGVIDLSR